MTHHHGRHRKPQQHDVARAAARVATVGTTGLMLSTAGIALAPGSASAAPDSAWDALRRCEASDADGGWQANTGNGYFGGLQFAQSTWDAFKPAGAPARADLATRAQQIAAGERTLQSQGWGAWPTCSYKAGVRGYGVDLRTVPAAVPPAAPPAPDPAPAPPAVSAAGTYTVVSGDWLSAIAVAQGIADWHELYEANRQVIGDNPDLIFPGQELVVKMTALPPVPAPSPAPAPSSNHVSASGNVDPCPGGHLTQGFSAGSHNGIDLAASIGTPIYAAAAGSVTVAGPRDPGGFGQAVYIDGDDGNTYWYGHIDTWTVNAGEHVNAGEQIATVGARGNSTGPHLHFEVHIGPGPVNPLAWLRDRGFRD